MIRVKGLTKTFGNTLAVNNVSFALDKGETLALIGTSGCGKTTTLKMINGLIRPDKGKIELFGRDVGRNISVDLRRKMGYVIQEAGLFPHYTIYENIAVVPRMLGMKEEEIQEKIRVLMKRLNLDYDIFKDQYPDTLSGGQQQRVGLARALAAEPPVVLMDEPFGALDPITRAEIQNDFLKLEEFSEKTIILVTHDVREAFLLADTICLMDKGEVQQYGTTEELLFSPANSFVSDFLKESRYELLQTSLTVKELLSFLPNKGKSGETIKEVAVGLTIKEVIEQFYSDPEAIGSVNLQEKKYLFTLPDLMKAFQQMIKERGVDGK